MSVEYPPPAEIPAEIWFLRRLDGGYGTRGQWVSEGDVDGDAGDAPTYLACGSEGDAKRSAKFLDDQYGIDAIPVRVK